MTYESLYVDAGGRTGRTQFAVALLPLIAAATFYHLLVWGPTGKWCAIVLLFPALMLHARRFHDMGRSAWLLLIPGIPVILAVWLRMLNPGTGYEDATVLAAYALSAAFTLWGLAGASEAGANRYGEPSKR